MLHKIQPALSEYYSDNAAPLTSQIFSDIWKNFDSNQAKTNIETAKKLPSVLDLGMAYADSFNFYSKNSCYLTIADCIEALSSLNWPEDDNPNLLITRQIEKIIPFSNKQYDLILVWDSFNYINPKIIPYLHNHLLQFCTNKTYVHGFLLTSEYRPKNLGEFKILEADKILHSVLNDSVVQHTPLTPHAINKAMPNFKYSRSVLMANGLQEFLLTKT